MPFILILFDVNCTYTFVLTALETILSLMPATSYLKAIGGVC